MTNAIVELATPTPDIELYMIPDLKPYGKSVWRATLAMLDNEKLTPADYVMLEAFCQAAEQLREMNSKIKSEPFYVVDGMMKANQLGWPAQSLVKTIAMLSDKLGINRAMRTAGTTNTIDPELQAFLRGVPNVKPKHVSL